jgi:flagellar hook-length control protein FliK
MMLQTRAAGSSPLELLSPESKSTSSKPSSGSSGFSQEFEKEVKKIDKPAGNKPSEASKDQVDKPVKGSGESVSSVSAKDAPKREEEAASEISEQGLDKEGGKILPLALRLENKVEAEEPLDEMPDEALLQVLNEAQPDKDELELDEETRLDPVLALASPMQPIGESTSEAELEVEGGDGEEVPQLLRDMMRQRQLMAGGERVIDPAANNKSARGDFALDLAAQTAQNSATPRGAGAAEAGLALNGPGAGTHQPAANSSVQLPAQFHLNQPMDQKGWDQAMGQRVVWMARNNMQEAQLQLNPRELGPINVRISVSNEQANVHFTAQHATTREALENAMPRLREMMQDAGLNLAQSDVSRQFSGQGGGAMGHGQAGVAIADPLALDDEDAVESTMLHHSQVPLGAVDYFA